MKSINTFTLEELESEINSLETKIEAINVKLTPLENARKRHWDRKAKVMERIAELKAGDIEYVINHINAWSQWQKMLPKQAFEHGYWGDTNQQAFKLKLNYMEEPAQDLIDFIERYETVALEVRIGIFRHDLSERGIWQVEKIDGEWVVYDYTSYDYKYQKKYEFKTKDLVEMLRYVAKHHWYHGGSDEFTEFENEF